MRLPLPLVLPWEVCETLASAAPSNVPSFGAFVTSLMVPPIEPDP